MMILKISILCCLFICTNTANAQIEYVKIGKDSELVNKTLLREEFRESLCDPFRSIYLIINNDRGILGPIKSYNDTDFVLAFPYIPFHLIPSGKIKISKVFAIIEDRHYTLQGTIIGATAGVITSSILSSNSRGFWIGSDFLFTTLSLALLEGLAGGYIGSQIPRRGMNFPIDFIR